MAVEAYMQEHRVQGVSWQIALNNRASTRPKVHGGPIVPPIKACKTFSEPGSARAVLECTLDLPRSFAGGDGLRVQTNGKGGAKTQR